MVRIHFECDRALRLEFIFFAERLVRLLEKLRHIRPQDGTLFLVKLDFEVRGLVPVEVGKAVQKRERVVGRNVERITRGRLLERGFSFLFLTDPQQIDSEHAHCVPVVRIQAKRLAREIHSLLVKAQ